MKINQTKTVELGVMHRALSLDPDSVNTESRTVDVVFSSEEPAPQYYAGEVRKEILEHSKDAADLRLLNQGAAVIVNHVVHQHVGITSNARLTPDKRGRVQLRFGRSEFASEILQDVQDGIRTGISFGYRVLEYMIEEGGEIVRALKWQPYEVTIASIPADPFNTGSNRSSPSDLYPSKEIYKVDPKTENSNTNGQTGQRSDTTDTKPTAYQAAVNKQLVTKERERCDHINILGDTYGCRDVAAEYVRSGRSVAEMERYLKDNQTGQTGGETVLGLSGQKPVAQRTLDMEPKQIAEFRMTRAINAIINPNDQSAQKRAAFELECSSAAMKLTGQECSGIMVPNGEGGERAQARIPEDVLQADRLQGSHQRTLLTTSAPSAGNLINTDLRSGSFIDVLRNSTILGALGARILTDLSGDVAIPRKTSSVTAGWLATEETSITATNLATDLLSMSPKDLGARQDVSRKLMTQSSLGVEQMTRDDIAQTIAVGWDLAGFYGTGLVGQPLGLANTPGIGAPTAFAAATPTWAEVTAMLGNIAVNNALQGSLAYVVEGAMMASLMAQPKDAGSGQFVYQGGRIGDYPAPFSNQIVSGDVFLGNFQDFLIGMWGGGLDLMVDPYTLADKRLVRIIGSIMVDFGVRHPQSFALNNDT